VSKADDIKNKFGNKRDARSTLMGSPNNNVNINDNVSGNVNKNNNDEINIDDIINRTSEKSEKLLVGIYFDPDVKKALDRYQQKEKKGAKSQFVNDITRWALKQKGLL
jgi:hypothetical protein